MKAEGKYCPDCGHSMILVLEEKVEEIKVFPYWILSVLMIVIMALGWITEITLIMIGIFIVLVILINGEGEVRTKFY